MLEEDGKHVNALSKDPVHEVYLQPSRHESHFAIYIHTTLEGMSSATHFKS